ncbi:MAG: hypothetical protein JO257_37080 [Deltaproteobacteria bacterium]|nr:hypothetical protein [Deltaproteobacteria bacterium]
MRGIALCAVVIASCGGGGKAKPGDAAGNGDSGPPPPPPAPTCTPPVMPVDTSHPDHVVGDGTAASCTQAALATAIAAGGTITFSCGTAPVTIAITQTLAARTDVDTTLDGGGTVTLDGGGTAQILSFDHNNYRVNTTTLTLQHIAFAHGRAHGTKMYAQAPAPCSQGYYDGYAGAVYMKDGQLVVIDATFEANEAESLGPDVGGGAIALLGCKHAVIVGSVFHANKGANGGAIASLNSDFDVYNTAFADNVAEGNGANGDDASMCSVLADNGQHQTGSGGNGGAVVIDGGSDGVHTFCGSVFTNNTGGAAALGGALFRTPDLAKQPTVIDRCTFDGNRGESGGAAYFHNSALTITASTFSNNTSMKSSGALQADGTTFALTNDTFTGNAALAGLGGAIALFGGDGAITFTTFSGNHADGGDPYFGAAIAGNAPLTLTSDIFANNTALNSGAPMQCHVMGTGEGNVQWPRTHVIGGAADAPCTPTTTFADPLLGALGSNGGPTDTLVPGAGSPAIGAGVNCPATDQRGRTRPAMGCSSGSVEP